MGIGGLGSPQASARGPAPLVLSPSHPARGRELPGNSNTLITDRLGPCVAVVVDNSRRRLPSSSSGRTTSLIAFRNDG